MQIFHEAFALFGILGVAVFWGLKMLLTLVLLRWWKKRRDARRGVAPKAP